MVSPRQKRQQLWRAEVLARNKLPVRQPTTSKSCDTEKQLSKPAQPNELPHINNQGGSNTRTTWCKKWRKRNILAENRKKKKCHQSPAVAVDDRNENKSYFTRSNLKEQYFPVQGNRIISLSTLSNNLKQCISCIMDLFNFQVLCKKLVKDFLVKFILNAAFVAKSMWSIHHWLKITRQVPKLSTSKLFLALSMQGWENSSWSQLWPVWKFLVFQPHVLRT